jgi:uncharacterized glyoxalase superfamily protein PhnB
MTANLRPNLAYEDARKAIRFLVDTLGFTVTAQYDGPGGSIAHAELDWPDGGGIMLHSADSPQNSVRGIAATLAQAGYPAFSVHIDTPEPDALYARVLAAGATIVRELADSPHGTRGFVVSDSEGLYWSLGTRLPKQVRNAEGWREDVRA